MKKSLPIIATAVALAGMSVPLQAQEEEAPSIIFISENTSADTAIETLILEEYNAARREELRTTDIDAYNDYEAIESIRQVPRDLVNTRTAELLSLLGLSEDDPADKGFTDLLEAAGYNVYRSETTVTEDPITGAVDRNHEFWGDIGEPFSADGDYRLSEEQIAFLSTADLIIFSKDVQASRYAWGGREGGEASTVLIEQWNGLEVPIIAMDPVLMETNEWGSWGWGLSYGYSGQFNADSAYNQENTDPQFVFPDLRPKIVTEVAGILDGVTPVDDERVPLYLDYAEMPELPVTMRKFSNNMNYSYPDNAKIILELDMPPFFNIEVGRIDTRDPVIVEFQAGIPGFQPQAGVPAIERVGTPAATRMFFAAGAAGTGLFNLSETGETVFLNTVGKLTGFSNGGTDPGDNNLWYGYAYDDEGWALTEGWLGWVNVTSDPWILHLGLDKYIAVPDDSGWVYIPGN
jgi:hypothetical protein